VEVKTIKLQEKSLLENLRGFQLDRYFLDRILKVWALKNKQQAEWWVLGVGGVEKRELLFNGYRVLVMQDKKVLEIS
jgi:hypothetical protein